MEEIIFDKYMDIKHWASRMMDIYGPDEDVYVLIRNKQIIHYSLRDEFSDKIIDNRYIIKKKTKLKCLLFISMKFDLDASGVEFVFNLNYMGTLLPAQLFARDMIGRTGCSIINISSMNAFTPLTKIPAYSGAKAAVSNFTQWLAVHFSQVGIRCNAIAPGFFVTKQNEKLLFNEDGSPTTRTQKILRNTPMDRFGKAEELIGAIIFLASAEASGFVNGVVLPIDGGFNAYSGV